MNISSNCWFEKETDNHLAFPSFPSLLHLTYTCSFFYSIYSFFSPLHIAISHLSLSLSLLLLLSVLLSLPYFFFHLPYSFPPSSPLFFSFPFFSSFLLYPPAIFSSHAAVPFTVSPLQIIIIRSNDLYTYLIIFSSPLTPCAQFLCK